MNQQPKLAILLATFNGEEFLAQQLDSILQQSYQNFIIISRDDGSEDATTEILAQYANAHEDKFHLLNETNGKRLGASGSFSTLIEYTLENKAALGLESAYMLFSDQDDVWQVDKVEAQLSRLLTLENGSKDKAVLVHSDLCVVDHHLSPIAESFIQYQGLDSSKNSFGQLLISNTVTGCTAFINEALASQACPIPSEAVMHDWWLGLVASAFGEIGFIHQPLVNYRQHQSNTLGAQEHKPATLSSGELWKKMAYRPYTPLFEAVATQAQAFDARFSMRLSLSEKALLWIIAGLKIRLGYLQRILFRLWRALA